MPRGSAFSPLLGCLIAWDSRQPLLSLLRPASEVILMNSGRRHRYRRDQVSAPRAVVTTQAAAREVCPYPGSMRDAWGGGATAKGVTAVRGNPGSVTGTSAMYSDLLATTYCERWGGALLDHAMNCQLIFSRNPEAPHAPCVWEENLCGIFVLTSADGARPADGCGRSNGASFIKRGTPVRQGGGEGDGGVTPTLPVCFQGGILEPFETENW